MVVNYLLLIKEHKMAFNDLVYVFELKTYILLSKLKFDIEESGLVIYNFIYKFVMEHVESNE